MFIIFSYSRSSAKKNVNNMFVVQSPFNAGLSPTQPVVSLIHIY